MPRVLKTTIILLLCSLGLMACNTTSPHYRTSASLHIGGGHGYHNGYRPHYRPYYVRPGYRHHHHHVKPRKRPHRGHHGKNRHKHHNVKHAHPHRPGHAHNHKHPNRPRHANGKGKNHRKPVRGHGRHKDRRPCARTQKGCRA